MTIEKQDKNRHQKTISKLIDNAKNGDVFSQYQLHQFKTKEGSLF